MLSLQWKLNVRDCVWFLLLENESNLQQLRLRLAQFTLQKFIINMQHKLFQKNLLNYDVMLGNYDICIEKSFLKIS